MKEEPKKELLSYSNLFDKSFQQKVIAQYSAELIIILQDVKIVLESCQSTFVRCHLYDLGLISNSNYPYAKHEIFIGNNHLNPKVST